MGSRSGPVRAALHLPRAILANAASALIAHNYPSGDPTPSAEDRAVTRQLRPAGALVGIEVLDHLLVGDGIRYFSFSERGALDPIAGTAA